MMSSDKCLTLGTTSTVSNNNNGNKSAEVHREREDTFNLRGMGGADGGGIKTPRLGAFNG